MEQSEPTVSNATEPVAPCVPSTTTHSSAAGGVVPTAAATVTGSSAIPLVSDAETSGLGALGDKDLVLEVRMRLRGKSVEVFDQSWSTGLPDASDPEFAAVAYQLATDSLDSKVTFAKARYHHYLQKLIKAARPEPKSGLPDDGLFDQYVPLPQPVETFESIGLPVPGSGKPSTTD